MYIIYIHIYTYINMYIYIYISVCTCVYVCVCMCMCVCVCVLCEFTSIHREGFICLGLEIQGTDQRCCVGDVTFLYQVCSSLL